MQNFIDFGTFLNSGTRERINMVSSSFASGYLLSPCNSLSLYCAAHMKHDLLHLNLLYFLLSTAYPLPLHNSSWLVSQQLQEIQLIIRRIPLPTCLDCQTKFFTSSITIHNHSCLTKSSILVENRKLNEKQKYLLITLFTFIIHIQYQIHSPSRYDSIFTVY